MQSDGRSLGTVGARQGSIAEVLGFTAATAAKFAKRVAKLRAAGNTDDEAVNAELTAINVERKANETATRPNSSLSSSASDAPDNSSDLFQTIETIPEGTDPSNSTADVDMVYAVQAGCEDELPLNSFRIIETVTNGDCFYDSMSKLNSSWGNKDEIRRYVASMYQFENPDALSPVQQGNYTYLYDRLKLQVDSWSEGGESVLQEVVDEYPKLKELATANKKVELMQLYGTIVAKPQHWANYPEMEAFAEAKQVTICIYEWTGQPDNSAVRSLPAFRLNERAENDAYMLLWENYTSRAGESAHFKALSTD